MLKSLLGGGGVGVDKCVACIYILQRMWYELEPVNPVKRPALRRSGQKVNVSAGRPSLSALASMLPTSPHPSPPLSPPR